MFAKKMFVKPKFNLSPFKEVKKMYNELIFS